MATPRSVPIRRVRNTRHPPPPSNDSQQYDPLLVRTRSNNFIQNTIVKFHHQRVTLRLWRRSGGLRCLDPRSGAEQHRRHRQQPEAIEFHLTRKVGIISRYSDHFVRNIFKHRVTITSWSMQCAGLYCVSDAQQIRTPLYKSSSSSGRGC